MNSRSNKPRCRTSNRAPRHAGSRHGRTTNRKRKPISNDIGFREHGKRAHFCRILKAYVSYYNAVRTHLSLNKGTSIDRPIHRFGRIISMPVLGGLHHQYCRT
jgi:hypothetical protein